MSSSHWGPCLSDQLQWPSAIQKDNNITLKAISLRQCKEFTQIHNLWRDFFIAELFNGKIKIENSEYFLFYIVCVFVCLLVCLFVFVFCLCLCFFCFVLFCRYAYRRQYCVATESKATYCITVLLLPVKCALKGNMPMFWINLEGSLEEGIILKGICQVAVQLVIWICSPYSGKLIARTCILEQSEGRRRGVR